MSLINVIYLDGGDGSDTYTVDESITNTTAILNDSGPLPFLNTNIDQKIMKTSDVLGAAFLYYSSQFNSKFNSMG